MRQLSYHQIFCIALLVFLISAKPSESKTYRWIDEKGVTHFSDNRPIIPEKKKDAAANKIEKQKEGKKLQNRAKKNRFYDFREKVLKVLDVDVIQLDSGKIIKYIGVKAPSGFLKGKVEKTNISVEFHRKLVEGNIVTILLGKKKKDSKGYFMGHVFLGRDIFVNAELIRSGYALTEEYPSDFEYQSLFIRLLNDARKRRAGIWDLLVQ